ncbi:DUF4956 domain-containing protein [Candidatus Pelagibacter sp.]|jgi:hypothetical protein|nr:DUF4956 domain-containing protein [Candidatus Pelagibacter sp.]
MNNTENIFDNKQFNNFFFNQNIEIDFFNFFIAIFLSLILSIMVKFTYKKVGRALNDKDYFSDTFIPLCMITTLVITVIKFSLALSLGLVGALSIVRFRAAIKEPEELVYLFFVISIGLANGANQFVLSIIATLLIISFLLLRNFFISKRINEFEFNSDVNILNIEIKNSTKTLEEIIENLNIHLDYLKIKSADFNGEINSYVFWFNLKENQTHNFLSTLNNLSKDGVQLSMYSKTGAFE